MSFALGILESEVVAMVAVVDLYLTGTGNGKSLGRSLMRFDFSHFIYSFKRDLIYMRRLPRGLIF